MSLEKLFFFFFFFLISLCTCKVFECTESGCICFFDDDHGLTIDCSSRTSLTDLPVAPKRITDLAMTIIMTGTPFCHMFGLSPPHSSYSRAVVVCDNGLPSPMPTRQPSTMPTGPAPGQELGLGHLTLGTLLGIISALVICITGCGICWGVSKVRHVINVS